MRPGNDFLGRLAAMLPRHLAVIVALIGIGGALAYALSEETPVGSIVGKVVLDENDVPLSDVKILLDTSVASTSGDTYTGRYAVSGKDGLFRLSRVVTGGYTLSASAEHHEVSEVYVSVDEGATSPITLRLKRTESALAMKQHQRVFGTKEQPYLGVSGYVSSDTGAKRDTLRVRLYQTRLSAVMSNPASAQALESVGRDYDPAPRLPNALLRPKAGAAPVRILEKEFPITEDDREGFYHQKFELDTLKTGLYLAEVQHEKQIVCTWLLVTDSALIVKQADRQVVAYLADMQTGTPLGNAVVRAYRKGRVVAQGQTDARGLVELTLPKSASRPAPSEESDTGDDSSPIYEDSDAGRVLLIAQRGDDEAVVNGWANQMENRGAFTFHAYTERPIYRPGQRIYFKGIARHNPPPPSASGTQPLDALPDSGPAYRVPVGEKVAVELRTPTGERLYKNRLTTNRYGSVFDSVELSPEAPTGVYTLRMRAGGTTHTHDIVIASYKKPEFSVSVTPEKKRYARGETVTMKVDAQYYFGAPVAGAKVTYYVYSDPDWMEEYDEESGDSEEEPDFSAFPGHSRSYYGESVLDGETKLDENGQAVLSFPAKAESKPGAPQNDIYTVSVSVVAEENREVSETGKVQVSAGDIRLGLKTEGYLAQPGQPANIALRVRDFEGRPLSNVPVTVETGYQKWDRSGIHYEKVGIQRVVSGADGTGAFSVVPPRSGEFVMKAHVTDSKRRYIWSKAYLWVADDRGGDLGTTYDDLSVLPDKRRYKPGETARVMLNARRTGQTALLTIEGDRVYRTQLVPMTQKSVVVRVPILAEYGPNISLAACYIQNKRFASSEANLRVSVPEHELNIAVRADRDSTGTTASSSDATPTLPRYHPGDKITYRITTTDARGKPTPCEFSFGVVDESLYALREDYPNALRDSFYPRRYNRVSTSYSFAVEYLGDADKAEPKISARKRFPDIAYWEPALQTDAQGRATVSFQLPDNLTTWRATANAQTLDTRVGYAAQKVLSAKDFMVRLETPRFLTQRDGSRLTAIVHNETGVRQQAFVRLTADNLRVNDRDIQPLTLEPGQTGQASWQVTAENPGDVKLRVTAWTVRNSGQPQYTDGLETTLPIRPYGREDIVSFAGQVTASHPETEALRLDPAAIPAASHLTIRLTPSVATALIGALDYLIGYPYGCTEQTMSRFLPDLMAQRALRNSGLLVSIRTDELPRMVRNGLQRLYRFQHRETGGWGWWEHDEDDPWMTGYVLYGLATARAEGYTVEEKVLSEGRKAAVALLKKTPLEIDTRVFLIYGLALAGDRETARAERSKLLINEMTGQGWATLVLLDKLLGRDTGAAMAGLDRRAKTEEGMRYWTVRKYDYVSSDREATATAMRAMLAVNPRDPRITSSLRWLMLQRTGDHWENTRATAQVLAAFCDYLNANPITSSGGEVRITLNGRALQTVALTADTRNEREIVLRVPASKLRSDKNDVTLERVGGDSPIFYSVQLRQTVAMADLPPRVAPNVAGLEVKREYLRILPKQTGEDWRLDTEPTNNILKAGDAIQVRLTVKAPRDLSYVIIEDPFPAGCEANMRGEVDESGDWTFWWSSVDVRDDRIAFFARTLTQGEHVIEYTLRVQTPGTYNALPTLVEGMYAPGSRAETAGTRVEVRK